MDDFFEKKDGTDLNEESAENTEAAAVNENSAGTGTAEESNPQSIPENNNSYNPQGQYSPYGAQNYGYTDFGGTNLPPQNRINYSDIVPVENYKPMSRGLKVFALVMAAVILLTGVSVTGYFLGRNSVSSGTRKNVTVNLAAKPADSDEMTAAEVYEKVNSSIVGITVYNSAGNGSQASGVFYSNDGYIVTNDHIYSEVGAPKFKVYTSDGKEYDAKYVAGDQVSDLAVLKIDGSGFNAAEFGSSDEIIYGENVVAVGRPSDATQASSITKGIISSTGRRVKTTSNYSAKLIQTDSAINPGSSGGALVNMYGQVVGITSSKLAGVSYDAVGYAIPTKTMKRICEELIKNGKVVSRAKLGITYTAINSVMAEINEYDSVGLYVASVAEDSDLYGKVKEGDIITHINGIKVTSDEVVLDIIEESSAGDKISVTVLTKKGNETTLEAVLKANTGESSYSSEITLPNNSDSSEGSGGTFNFPFGE